MQTIFHKADTRGVANFGWLHSQHSFSFGHYYNPDRIRFGALRVLNDDIVQPGMGFGTHPHDNMEIVSIPLVGALAHKDSTGTEKVIRAGEVQIMSAGTGLTHSEYNHSRSEAVNFLQLWVLPRERNIQPRYDQKDFATLRMPNEWQTVVAPDDAQALWINQDAWFSLATLEQGKSLGYHMHNEANGIYVFVIEGGVVTGTHTISRRDALGIWDTPKVTLTASAQAELLVVEVPMF
jgi:redox-sensitive bicupin YhaK (pirin superfamily)